MTLNEKVMQGLEQCREWHGSCRKCPYNGMLDISECTANLCRDARILLKWREEQGKRILHTISDNQLGIGGADPLTDYEQGLWDGMQAAYEIVHEIIAEETPTIESKSEQKESK